jgi:hypothetical protein
MMSDPAADYNNYIYKVRRIEERIKQVGVMRAIDEEVNRRIKEQNLAPKPKVESENA